jgi:hypothetical protein
MARFDWYEATVPAPVDDVLEALCSLSEVTKLVHSRGHHGYGTRTTVEGLDGPLASVLHGGCHTYPHAVITGEGSQAGAECIRVAFPLHRVTRADACEDFGDAGAFDRIAPHLLTVAQSNRVKLDTRGDHLLTMQGRTIYLGAASSATRLRLYDKGAELRSKFAADPVRLAAVPEHLARLEAQVRPQTSESKARFATIEPLEVMGSSRWLRELWRLVAALELDPVQVGKGYRQSDDQRAYAYLLSQYGGLLRRMSQDLGDWACVGKQIGSDLAERAAVLPSQRSVLPGSR